MSQPLSTASSFPNHDSDEDVDDRLPTGQTRPAANGDTPAASVSPQPDKDEMRQVNYYVWRRLTQTSGCLISPTNDRLDAVDMITGDHVTLLGHYYSSETPSLVLGVNDARFTTFEYYNITKMLQQENLMFFVADLIRLNERDSQRCNKLRRVFSMFLHAHSVVTSGERFSCHALAEQMRPNQLDSCLIVALWHAALDFSDVVAGGRPGTTYSDIATAARARAQLDKPLGGATPTATVSSVPTVSIVPTATSSTSTLSGSVDDRASADTPDLDTTRARGATTVVDKLPVHVPADVRTSTPTSTTVSTTASTSGTEHDVVDLERRLSMLSTPKTEPEPKERKPQLAHDAPRDFTDYYGGRFFCGRFGNIIVICCFVLLLCPYILYSMGIVRDAGCELIRPPTCESYRVSHAVFNSMRRMYNTTGEMPMYLPECTRVSTYEIGIISVIQMYYSFFRWWFHIVFEWFMYIYTPVMWMACFVMFVNVLQLLAYNRPVREAIIQSFNFCVCGSFLVAAYYGPKIQLPDWTIDRMIMPWPERDQYYQCIENTSPLEIVYMVNWLMRYTWVCHVVLVWLFVTRRRVSYKLVGVENLVTLPDVRPTSHTVVPPMYSSGLYATYQVTDWDHNPYSLIKSFFDGTFRRYEIVSLEVAVSCLDPRIISRDIRSEDNRVQLRELMCARAGVENRVNIDRYTSAYSDVHYATARYAYHYKMHLVRHLPSNFKYGVNEDLYAFGYRVTEVKTKKATTLRAGCQFRLRARQTTGRMVVQVHLGCGDLIATVPAPDRAHGLSLFVGACVRLAPELPDPPIWFINYTRMRLPEWLSGLFQPVPPHANFCFEKWLSTRPYTESRKNELRKARESFPYMSNGPHNAFTAEGFIKAETYEGVWDAFATAMIDGDITDKVPRWICPTSDWTKAWIGPYISMIEHVVFTCPRFIKLIPGPKRAEFLFERLFAWIVEYLERDVTSAESHHREQWVPVMMDVYRWLLQDNLNEETLWVLYLIYQTMVNSNQPTLTTKFFTILKLVLLKSGRMDTSMVNVLLFMMIYDMQNAYRFGIDFNKLRPSMVLFEMWVNAFLDEKFGSRELGLIETQDIFEGDDSLTTAHDGKVLTDEMYREVGVKLESRKSVELTGTDFCGMIFDIIERIMITNIIAAYVNFGWASDAYLGVSNRRKLELMRARAYSLLYQYNSCPVLHELALYVLRATAHVDLTRFFRVRNKLSEWEMTQMRQAYDALRHVKVFTNRCGPRTRALVERLYGVSIEMQLRAESKLKSLKRVQMLCILPDTVFPTHWLTYNRDYVKAYSKHDIATRKFTSAEIDCPKYYPFAPDFFLKHGHQISGRNGTRGEAAVRDYLGL